MAEGEAEGETEGVTVGPGVTVALGRGVTVGFFALGVTVGEREGAGVAVAGGETKMTLISSSLGRGEVKAPLVVT